MKSVQDWKMRRQRRQCGTDEGSGNADCDSFGVEGALQSYNWEGTGHCISLVGKLHVGGPDCIAKGSVDCMIGTKTRETFLQKEPILEQLLG